MGKDTQLLGKQGEFFVFHKLLEREITVYAPIFDIEGIDCIIRTPKGKHIDIQVKTRKKEALFDYRGELSPRSDLYIICHIAEQEKTWVLPSKIFSKFSTKSKYKGTTLNRLTITKKIRKELLDYEDDEGFDALVRQAGTGKVKTKSGWQWLKQKYLQPGAKKIEIRPGMTKNTKEVYKRIQKMQKKMRI